MCFILRCHLSAGIKDQMMRHINQCTIAQNANPLFSLSAREREVMTLMVEGQSNINIARTLSLQVTTISTYKSRIFEKLEISNIMELMEKVKLYSN